MVSSSLEGIKKKSQIQTCFFLLVAMLWPRLLADKQHLHDVVRQVVEWRANNPPDDADDRLFVDVLIEMHGQDEDTLYADAITMLIGGVHTTGLRMYC